MAGQAVGSKLKSKLVSMVGLTEEHAAQTLQVLDVCYSSYRSDEGRGCHISFAGSHALECVGLYWEKECGEAPMTFGVEGWCFDPDVWDTDGLSYLNAGDTYAGTLGFHSGRREFLTGCMGDWVDES